jgi:cytochrome c
MYMLEYGTGWFQGNPDARLVRIEYNGGNRKPIVAVAVDKDAGPTPLRVALSSKGTSDPDADALRYQWTITGPAGTSPVTLRDPNPSYTFAKPGVYTATLAVTDAKGARSTSSVQISAGNEPPVVDLDVSGGNRSFWFPGTPVRYAVRVSDREDGSLENGQIQPDRVTVTADYLKDGVPTVAPVPAGHRAPPPHAEGLQLIQGSDCLACHQIDRKSIGPMYTDVAAKYRGDALALAKLATKVKSGGTGVWGNVMMPPHPQLTDAQATEMVAYVLSLNEKKSGPSLPVKGEYTPPTQTAPASGAPIQGAVVLHASYTDRGANGLPGATSETSLTLRAPTVVVATGELGEGVTKMQVPQLPVPLTMPSKTGTWVRLKQIDLTGITEVIVSATAPAQYGYGGGKVEFRADSASGALLGETGMVEATSAANAPPAQLHAPLKPTTGMHDVYMVFRNDQLKTGQAPFIALTATFVSGSSSASAR